MSAAMTDTMIIAIAGHRANLEAEKTRREVFEREVAALRAAAAPEIAPPTNVVPMVRERQPRKREPVRPAEQGKPMDRAAGQRIAKELGLVKQS